MAHGASLLQAESFPKTFNDLAFADRMAVLRDGYADFESVYDAQGKCISGCAYNGISLGDALEATRRATELAQMKIKQYKLQHPQEFADTTHTPHKASDITTPMPDGRVPEYTAPTKTDPSKNDDNSVYAEKIVPRNIISQPPLLGKITVTSEFGYRWHPIDRHYKKHSGVDLAAGAGANDYATANGTVTHVDNQPDGCGLYVTISHSNGFETMYCHLSRQLVNTGDVVSAGHIIGLVGSTGKSTGPHLHYVVKQNGEPIDPVPFFK